MEIKQEATELSQASATGGPLQVLWFFVHLAVIYLIVHFCTPWLAGWVRGNLLPFLQQPTSSDPLEFLFSHLFAFSFFPALLAGAANAKFRHGSAECGLAHSRSHFDVQVGYFSVGYVGTCPQRNLAGFSSLLQW
jgi:hypothetical protein